jgi:hypothetical protein
LPSSGGAINHDPPVIELNPSIAGKISFSYEKEKRKKLRHITARVLYGYSYVRRKATGGESGGLRRRGNGRSRIHFDLDTSSDLIHFLI